MKIEDSEDSSIEQIPPPDHFSLKSGSNTIFFEKDEFVVHLGLLNALYPGSNFRYQKTDSFCSQTWKSDNHAWFLPVRVSRSLPLVFLPNDYNWTNLNHL